MENYVVVDMEMTGLNLASDEVIEIGAWKVKDHRIAQFHTLLQPVRRQLDSQVEELTGITEKMLENAVSQEQGMRDFLTFSEDLPLVGHRISWDYTFLKRWGKEQGIAIERQGVDTLELARRFLPQLEHRSLDYLCQYYGIERTRNHRALEDAWATLILFRTLETEFMEEGEKYFIPKKIAYHLKKSKKASPKELERLKKLLQYHNIKEEIEWETLTQSEASRKIDLILSAYGRIPQGIQVTKDGGL